MKPLLSIIIPTYNASSYIVRCLDSITGQNIAKKDNDSSLEIIIVDDCSLDDTYQEVIKYKKEREIEYIRIIRHEKNKQQGAARNTGLRQATGNYVWFVDIDDYIVEGFLDILYNYSSINNCDVFQFNAITESIDGEQQYPNYMQEVIMNISGEEYLLYEANIEYDFRIKATWSKWYRRKFLLKNKLFFKEGVYWEDIVHTFKCIYLAKSFMYMPILGYVYVQTPNSDMRSTPNGRKYADTIRFCNESFEFMLSNYVPKRICDFQSVYYKKTLRKYKLKLHELSFNEFLVFNNIIRSMDLSNIKTYCKTNEYDWLYSNIGRFFIWIV